MNIAKTIKLENKHTIICINICVWLSAGRKGRRSVCVRQTLNV